MAGVDGVWISWSFMRCLWRARRERELLPIHPAAPVLPETDADAHLREIRELREAHGNKRARRWWAAHQRRKAAAARAGRR